MTLRKRQVIFRKIMRREAFEKIMRTGKKSAVEQIKKCREKLCWMVLSSGMEDYHQ